MSDSLPHNVNGARNVNGPRNVNGVSRAELERRWSAVRERMDELGLDALVVQNSSDWVGGYIRWFSNQPATNGYPSTLVFARSGGMSLIEQGPFGLVHEAGAEQHQATGITRHLTTPSYPSIHYTGTYDAELAAAEVRLLGARRVGLVAPAAMYHSFGAGLRRALADLDVVDATDAIDRLKAIKSAEERELIRAVAAMQDEVMARVAEFLRPGLADFEVAAHAQHVGQQLGSEQGIFLCSSAPAGEAARFRPRHLQGRRMQAGDVYSLLVENNGAGGFYTELSRIFVLGRAPGELRDAHARVLEAQDYALGLLRPGSACRAIYAEHNRWLAERDMPEERRLSIHGMGYDMVERPLIRDDEDMVLAEHMSIVCHPSLSTNRLFVHNTDNYLIEADGPGPCLHRTPKRIIEVT
jgi:Xaa-Pro aminopeptidase